MERTLKYHLTDKNPKSLEANKNLEWRGPVEVTWSNLLSQQTHTSEQVD